ncbi:TPA: exonuclease domain-containing protein [Photobacterium damselae]
MRAIDYYISKIENFEKMTFSERRDSIKNNAINREKMHTKATLKALFRLKPAANATPAGSYVNNYKQEINLFFPKDCVPMREISKKTRSEAQIKATNKLIDEALKRSPKGRAISLCKSLIAEKAVVIDTETTDLEGVAIQIALVCCETKEVLYNSLIHTNEPISQEAYNVHGIDQSMLINAPKPEQVADEINKIIGDKTIVAFNSKFDIKICKNTFVNNQKWLENKAVCAMYNIAVPVLGSTNKYGTISLTNALKYANIEWRGKAHDASGDALATADLIDKISKL